MAAQGDNGGPARPLYERLMTVLALQGTKKIDLARKSGVARTAIDRLATQPRPPQAQTVHKLAAALGIDPVEALTLAGLMPESGSQPAPSLAVHEGGSPPRYADPAEQYIADTPGLDPEDAELLVMLRRRLLAARQHRTGT
jgi:transcriptional regulator with XRE-family HTH domain